MAHLAGQHSDLTTVVRIVCDQATPELGVGPETLDPAITSQSAADQQAESPTALLQAAQRLRQRNFCAVNETLRRALILPWLLSVLSFAQAVDPGLAAGLQLLDEGRTTLKENPLNQARDYFLKLTQQNPRNALYFYELARVDYYRCLSVRESKGNKGAVPILDQAISEAQESLQLDERAAVAHSLLADLYGNKIGLGGGFMLGARFGPKVDEENKRALELDSNSPRVLASLGRQYLHAPKMFGGDLDKAIANLQKAIEHDDGADAAADETYVWLGIAYRKKGDGTAASKAFDQALRRNPRSVFALNTKAGR